MFTSANEFSTHIEQRAYDDNLSLTDALLAYCEEHNLEPDDIKTMVSQSLKDKLAVELRATGHLPQVATLEGM